MKKVIVSVMMAAAFIFAANAQSAKATKSEAKAAVTQTKKDAKATKEAAKTEVKAAKEVKKPTQKKLLK